MIETKQLLINPHHIRTVTKNVFITVVQGLQIVFKDGSAIYLDRHDDKIDPEKVCNEIRSMQAKPINYSPVDFNGQLINLNNVIVVFRPKTGGQVNVWFANADKSVIIKTDNVETLWNLLKGEGS